MDATHLPAVIGLCVHCHLPLYAGAAVAKAPALAHVGCEVNAHRHGQAPL